LSQHRFTIADANIAAKVQGRLSISLDMNVWNHVAREVNEDASYIKSRLEELVAAGKIFCPVTFSNIVEILKQNYESALRTGSLMEELSLNLSFGIDKEIYKKEIANFLRRFVDESEQPLPIADVYVPMMAFLESNGSLLFPEQLPGSSDKREEITQEFTNRLSGMKLTDMLDGFKDKLPMPISDLVSAPEYSDVWKERWDAAKGNKGKMRLVEQDHFVREVLTPGLHEQGNKLPPEARRKFNEYILALREKNDPSAATSEIIKHMPAMRTAIEIMTITGFDLTRKATLNDFFDIQMLMIPLSYADVLVATDKWLRHLLTTQKSVFDTGNVRYISSLSDFREYLKGL
jgi:hypothetical protein